MQTIKDHNIDLSASYAIGDTIRDCSICETSSCKGFLIADNEKDETIKAVKAREIKNVSYATDLLDAAKAILGNV